MLCVSLCAFVLAHVTALRASLRLRPRLMNPSSPVIHTFACRYSTATGDSLLDDVSLVIHAFFADFCPRPVHLCVDTRLHADRIDCHAYVSASNALTESVLVAFQELKTNVVASPEARVGIDAMLKTTTSTRAAGEHGAWALIRVAVALPAVAFAPCPRRLLATLVHQHPPTLACLPSVIRLSSACSLLRLHGAHARH